MTNEEWAYGLLSERLRQGMDENRIAALEAEVKALRADVEHIMVSTFIKRRKAPHEPESRDPRTGPVWDGSETPGCPTKR